jgi:hypothetical protein
MIDKKFIFSRQTRFFSPRLPSRFTDKPLLSDAECPTFSDEAYETAAKTFEAVGQTLLRDGKTVVKVGGTQSFFIRLSSPVHL